MRPDPLPIDAEKLLAEASWVGRLARSLVRDDAAAQDIVQAAWVAALESAPSGEERLRPWLARVVRNFASQSLRGDAHRTSRERGSARSERTPSAAETAERIEGQRLLVEALAALDEPYRTTVTLRYLEGLSAAAIARREGVPAGTVRWRLKEGLDRLRARLDRRFGGERKSWALAFVPLLRRPPIGEILAASGAAVLQGVWMMNTALKLGIAAALVVAASVGIWWTVDRPGELVAPAASTAEVAGLAASPTAPERALAESASGGSARASLPAASRPAEPPAAAAPTSSRLSARCVDPAGTPLAGVRFFARNGTGVEALSAKDGRVSIELELRRASQSVPLVASLPGRATRFESIVLDRGKATELGDFVLEPGGAVQGLVVGTDGRPVAGASVLVTKPEFADRLEALRRRGPLLTPDVPPVPTATTDANGTFLVEGVPARSVRVWAGAEGTLYACTDPIEIAAGETRSGIRLALEALAPEDVIEGVVLAPDGAPVPAAGVSAYWSGGFSSGGASLVAGADGRFQIRVRERVPHDLRIVDPEARWPETVCSGVRPGARNLEVRFSERGEVELAVASRRGAPVMRFATTLLSADGEHILDHAAEADHEGGRGRLRIPPVPFVLDVFARGHARGRLGPFEPGAVPPSLACELEALPGVRGRVVAAGKPVPGATLELHAFAPAGTRVVSDGFPTRLDSHVTDAVTTDAEGRFDFTVRAAGTYAIVAEAEGLATAELSPLEIAPAAGVDGLEVAMSAGGAIEGRVLLPGGRDPAGTIVGLSRGDGYPRTARAGADGSFRFERLAPGRWNLTRAEAEVRDRGQTSTWSMAHEPPSVPWNCTVAEGRTTRFDLDLRDDVPCVLALEVALGGRPVEGWTLSIQTSGELVMTGAGVDARGKARAEIEAPGNYVAVLRTAGDGFDASFHRRTELVRGETPWRLEVATGGVEGRVRGATAAGAHLLYHWDGPDGVVFEAWFTADADGRFRLPLVPEGQGTIRRLEGEDADARRWTSAREVSVKAGEVLRVDLD